MAAGGMLFRLAFAALVSGAAAGLLLPLLLAMAGLLAGAPPIWSAFGRLSVLLPLGPAAGLVFATLPAFFAGASMWALGERFGSAGRPPAWAAAGAAVGAALWLLFELAADSFGGSGPEAFDAALLATGLAAGAGGALAFRAAMRLAGGTFGNARRGRP